MQGRDGSGEGSFNATGTLLLTVVEGGAILWDVASGKEIRSLRGHTDRVTSAELSPDGTRALTTSYDHTTRLWDTRTGRFEIIESDAATRVSSAVFTPDGATIALGRAGGVSLRTVSSPTLEVARLPCSCVDYTIAILADGKTVHVSTGRETLLLDATTTRAPFEKQPEGMVRSASNARGDVLAFYAVLRGVMLQDGAGTRLLYAEPPPPIGMEKPERISLDPSGRYLALILGDTNDREAGDIVVVDTATGKRKWRARVATSPRARFSPDGRLVYSGSTLFDAATGTVVRRFVGRALRSFGVGFSPDGLHLTSVHVAGASTSWGLGHHYAIKTWDLTSLRLEKSVSETLGLETEVLPAFTSDASKVVVIARDGWSKPSAARVWDVGADKVVRTLPTVQNGTFGASFSRDGTRVAMGGFDNPKLLVQLIDVRTGKVISSTQDKYYDSNGRGIALSLDGTLVAYGARGGDVALWSPSTGKTRHVRIATDDVVKNRAGFMVFSPSGDALAVVSGSNTVLIDIEKGEERLRIRGHERDGFFDTIRSLAFSPDGTRLATGGTDGVVRLWDTASGAQRLALRGHTDDLRGMAFAPNGKLLATSADQSIRLWDADTGDMLVSLAAIGDEDAAAFAPSGHYLASRGAARDLHFSKDLEVIPFESLDLVYNRPDIVLQRLGLTRAGRIDSLKRAWQKRLSWSGYTEEQLSGELQLPEVSIESDVPLETASRKLALAVRSTDDRSRVQRVHVTINEVPLFGAQGLPWISTDGTQRVELELSEGTNRIDVSVQNEKGAESLRKTMEVNYVGPRRPRTLHIVTVGVSDYGRPDLNLTYATKDARDVAAGFSSVGKKRFARVEKTLIVDQDASRDRILAVKSTLAKTEVDDQVVVFLAGHGFLDGNLDYFFGTPDVDVDNPAARGVPYADLEGLLDGIPARRKLLLMDTCFSGEVDKGATEEATRSVEGTVKMRPVGTRGFTRRNNVALDDSLDIVRELFADLRRSSGAVVISSAGGAE